MWVEHRFLSFDATPIFYRRLKPALRAKATVLIVHGMGEHGGRYRAAAERLGGMGYQVFIPDLRGFGKSGGKRACLRAFSDYHKDLGALHRFAASEEKETPVFLLGHSLGGLVAASYAALTQHPVLAGLVLSSPCFGIALPVPVWRHVLSIAASYVLPNFTQPTGLNPDYLTHDREIVERYKQDRLVFRGVSARLYHEMTRTMAFRGQIAGQIYCPTLMLQSGEDFIVSKNDSVAFYESLRCPSKAIEIYSGFYHELLNETNRSAVLTRIGSWIQENLILK